MPVILIGVAIAAAVVTYETGAFVIAIVNAVGSFWSNGVLANYRRHEAHDAPNWAAALSMLTTAIAIGLLIYGLVS